MEAAWNILQQDKPNDFVIATGETHSVREFLDEAFAAVDLDPDQYLKIDKRFLRPASTGTLLGDISKAKQTFSFEPKVKFEKLVKLMVDADLEEINQSKTQ